MNMQATENSSNVNPTTPTEPVNNDTQQPTANDQPKEVNHDWLPEKFRVQNDTVFDMEASFKKMAQSYTELEKRLGNPEGVPPKTAEEYNIKLEGDGLNFDEIKQDERYKSFLKDAHAAGMTNKQVEFAVNQYFKNAALVHLGESSLNAEQCIGNLMRKWGTTDQEVFNKNISVARKGLAVTYKDNITQERILKKYGNDPDVLDILYRIGQSTSEDAPASGGQSGQGTALQEEYQKLSNELITMQNDTPEYKAKLARRTQLFMQMREAGISI